MIDFHTHVLPGMDDGSRNTDMSIQMLKMMKADGITQVMATPHFYGERESIERFLNRREICIAHLKRKYTEDLPKISVGAEVAYFDGISGAGGLEQLCISGTELLLLEMPFSNWDDRIYREVEKLVKSNRFHLILAHVERYSGFQKGDSRYEDILDMDVTCQCNAERLLVWHKRNSVIRLFDRRRAALLGSDCHNLEKRRPNLAEGRAVLEKKLGTEILEYIDRSGEQLIEQYSEDGLQFI